MYWYKFPHNEFILKQRLNIMTLDKREYHFCFQKANATSRKERVVTIIPNLKMTLIGSEAKAPRGAIKLDRLSITLWELEKVIMSAVSFRRECCQGC